MKYHLDIHMKQMDYDNNYLDRDKTLPTPPLTYMQVFFLQF